MIHCFKCGFGQPPNMIYCLDCGSRLDEEPETVIRDWPNELSTFIEYGTGLRKAQKWIRVGVAAGILMACVLVLYSRRENPSPGPLSTNRTDMTSEVRMAGRQRVLPMAVRPGSPRLAKSSAERPSVTPKKLTVTNQTPPISAFSTAASIPRKWLKMNTYQQRIPSRMEIIDGVNHCYALPGGREIPC